ncbi:MAG: type IV pilus biogenesis/stability protein PilW [Xanthomonadales bacterium]|nr:type IV pilus biogenesis/stability protein PilW [Xanthomonadales bacterium]NNL96128.1 type IV pilus biogenesis/stability protein PilW [Xanthomonadales bacterium]
MIKSSLCIVFATVLLLGCATSSSRPDGPKSAARGVAEVNASLGQEYMSRGQLEIALDKLKKAVTADPTYAPAQTLLAVLYERIDDSEAAERHYRLAVEAAPKNGDVNNNYGVYLCHSRKAGEADPYFQAAVKDPFYRTPEVAYANAGSCWLQVGNLDKAERYLRQSLEYDAEFSDALLSMADISARRGDFLRARAFLQRYESTGSESAQSLLLAFRIESELGNGVTASAYRERLLSKFSNSEQARELRESGMPDHN